MKQLFISLAIVTFLVSCLGEEKTEKDDSKKTTQNESHGGHTHEKTPTDTELIHSQEPLYLSKEQIKTIDLQFGEFTKIKVNDFVKSTGLLGLPPNAYSSVSPKSDGIIKGNKKYVEGNYIKQGETIGYIENQEFILKQQSYLEARAMFILKKQNLERQTSLANSNAGVSKNLELAQAEYDIALAQKSGLSKQLKYLGISTEYLTADKIKQEIPIYAPMSGYITNIDMHNGMYAEPNKSLMEIISDKHLHLELDVFERDISSIKVGQKISYTVPALGNKIYEGEVSIIGKEFDTQSKTVRVHGHLDGDKPIFLKDLYINAKIWMNDLTSDALPNQSIIKDGANYLIYIGEESLEKDEINFIAIKVIPGASNTGFTSVKLLEPIPKGMKVVTNGAYYVYAQSMAGKLEHDH